MDNEASPADGSFRSPHERMRIRAPGRRIFSLVCIILSILTTAVGLAGQTMGQEIDWYGYEIVNRYPHDPAAFTQGLVWHDGHLYEGTGTEGASSLRKVKLESGEVVRKVDLDPEVFGEGIAVWRGSIIQLTWQHGIAFVRNLADLRERKRLHYSGEGWGLTSDGARLIMSNGSSTLTFRDPETFRVVGTVDVAFRGRSLRALNELEFVDGKVWANVWMTNQIVMIDPASGQVTGVLDLTGILSPVDRGGAPVDVLNGIAWDSEDQRIFVTGKYWPKLYEIRLVPK